MGGSIAKGLSVVPAQTRNTPMINTETIRLRPRSCSSLRPRVSGSFRGFSGFDGSANWHFHSSDASHSSGSSRIVLTNGSLLARLPRRFDGFDGFDGFDFLTGLTERVLRVLRVLRASGGIKAVNPFIIEHTQLSITIALGVSLLVLQRFLQALFQQLLIEEVR